jgi:hypothetical protein
MIKDGHITDQYELIRKHKILTEKQIDQVIKWGFEATFIPEMKNSNLYL